jgi:hypothetical protein
MAFENMPPLIDPKDESIVMEYDAMLRAADGAFAKPSERRQLPQYVASLRRAAATLGDPLMKIVAKELLLKYEHRKI